MKEVFLKGLNRSINSATAETNNFIKYYEKNLYSLIFFPYIINADIDYQSYCQLITDIKNQTNLILSKTELKSISSQIQEIPTVKISEFKVNRLLPFWLLYILLPLGIIYWVGYYIKINSLIDNLRKVESKLQTIAFMMKANIS